ncbi:hypothetical protein BH20ACT22_BH20ACT22_22300 [soil metagenome]
MIEPAGRSGGDRWAGRRVLVVGLGTSGNAAAHALVGLGAVVRVTEAGGGDPAEEREEGGGGKRDESEMGGRAYVD